MHALRYALDEAIMSLWRGRQSGLLSMATIAVALFVLGAFLLITSNLRRMADEWGQAAEVSVYLTDAASGADRAAVERLIAAAPVVAGQEFVSKDEALRRFKETFADLATTADTVGDNPLPASYEVRLKSGEGPESVERLVNSLKGAAGVSEVRYDRQWLERLVSAVSIVRMFGLVLGALLTGAAALTVANVVRLALFARRDELEIMDLVGAPPAYVRGPFVMEGVLQGGIGAVAALAGLAIVFLAIRRPFLLPLASALNLSSVRFLSPGLCLLLLAGGMLVGCVGGAVAAMRGTRSAVT